MPKPAAELVLYVYDIDKEGSEVAHKILTQEGFHPTEGDSSIISTDEYIAYHFQPFEDRVENVDLLDECVSRLADEFPETEFWLKSKQNKDYGNSVSHDYLLYISQSREAVSSSRYSNFEGSEQGRGQDEFKGFSSDKGGLSTDIEWRAESDDETCE